MRLDAVYHLPCVICRVFATVLAAMRPLVDVESRSRVRKASIVPLTVLCAALSEFGRCDATTAILTAVNKMPKQWRLELEAEVNASRDEVDLVLQEELESEECDELAEMDLAHELVLCALPYDACEEDEKKVANSALHPVPPSVEKQLQEYESFRMAPFCRQRTGAQVVTTTVESDKSNALRFLGYLKEHHGQAPRLALFAHTRIGEWTEKWMVWLKDEMGLKASTLAVYCNGVIAVTGYALTLVTEKEQDECPLQELLNLRKQAEAISKQERLFAVKSKHWLTWESAQEARVKCFNKYYACIQTKSKASVGEKQSLLRDCLVLAFHTLQPPYACTSCALDSNTYI